MDIQLARTFLTIISDGNFGTAANSLYITQSAVSLRIKRLEEILGERVFERSKGGVHLTPAGRRFEPFAISMVRIWEEARHQVAVPSKFEKRLIIGGQHSLLPKLVMRWLSRLERSLPEVAFRMEAGTPERLIRLLIEGSLDIAVMYTPQLRPGIVVEKLYQEELVLVTADLDYDGKIGNRYVLFDWGPEFLVEHGLAYPDLELPRVTLTVGPMGINYLLREKRAGYLPARSVKNHLASGNLALVPNAPTFSYPCYLVHNSDIDTETLGTALEDLRAIVEPLDAQQEILLGELEEITDQADETAPLGPG